MRKYGVLLDLTEFITRPNRTGIQRVCHEFVSRWEADSPLVPVQVGPDGQMRLLPDDTFATMTRYFRADGPEAETARRRLRAYGDEPGRELQPDAVAAYRALLNPELFFAESRLAFYERLLPRMRDRLFFLVYDFLPWLRPNLFARCGLACTMGYVRLVRAMEQLAFISEATRSDYLRRIVRRDRPTGPVLMLGSDGLGRAEPRFDPHSRRLTVVGSLEPRKNHGAILDAFEGLWEEGVDAELTFVGRWVFHEEGMRRRLERLQENQPRFQWLQELDDVAVRRLIRDSRATLFASQAEGFGLPPLESLALGVPVIVSDGLPSLAPLEAHGQVRLPQPDAPSIRRAVLDLLDDRFARRKYEEIRGLNLPTWADLSRRLGQWIEGNS
jgi:glycosyltransferase involved in cell wall biosynthesis